MIRLLSTSIAAPVLVLAWVAAPVRSHAGEPSTPTDCGSVHAYFDLRTAGWSGPCTQVFGDIVPGVLGHVSVAVHAVPFRKARFTLPDPPFGVVLEETWNFPVTGNRRTELEVDLGTCSDVDVVLGVLTVYVTNGTVGPCAEWRVLDGCEIDACDGRTYTGQAWPETFSYPPYEFCGCCFQCCQSLPPFGLSPADGAADVPLDVELAWAFPVFEVDPGEWVACWVSIGTDPACETGQWYLVPCTAGRFAPDFLAAETTYYWRMGYGTTAGSGCSNGDGGVTALHSFTTEELIPVARPTWGHVKSLYRD